MTVMDSTGAGIALGVLAAAGYAGVRAFRRLPFALLTTLVVFSGVFSIPAGWKLLWAAYVGDQALLPSSWREYVGFAGVAIIGIAANYTVRAYLSAWSRAGQTGVTETSKTAFPGQV